MASKTWGSKRFQRAGHLFKGRRKLPGDCRLILGTAVQRLNLTDHGLKTLKENPGRLGEVNREIEKMGARIREQWAVLGPYDFVNVVEAPDNETMARVSVEIGSRGSVRLVTLPAMPVDGFLRGLK